MNLFKEIIKEQVLQFHSNSFSDKVTTCTYIHATDIVVSIKLKGNMMSLTKQH